MNVDEKKTEVNHSLHCSWHIATSARHVGMNEDEFSLLATTQSRPIYCWAKLRFLMLLHFQGIVGMGHASKPEAR